MSDEQKKVVGRPFQKGQGGRPLGARNRLKEGFLAALEESFRKRGREAIERMIDDDPAAYVKVIASLLPKQISDEDDTVVVPPVLVIRAWEPGESDD